ncbi:uncharacterized protein LOC143922340 [Arctopsyche grandis]|uniref:uncharacterized protein LOC143922340 n=1 Tax=Arctopsyche grandis TaxID=121162 RepID=UPI00406D86FF
MEHHLFKVTLLVAVFACCTCEFQGRHSSRSRYRNNFMNNVFGKWTGSFQPKTDRPVAEKVSNFHGVDSVSNESRKSRFLSLLTLVTFPAESCAAASGNNGTCMSPEDCYRRGGSADGTCASGYGSCCVFMATCGSMTAENGTYFVNQGYPARFDGTASCQLTVAKSHPDVCQIRLDFDQFQITGPESINHICDNDQFIVSGGNPVPAICGINQGSHMYIDAGIGTTNPIILTFVTRGPSFQRNWKVRVSQIPCSTIYRAEEGCLQYYTQVSGQLRSFNYDPIGGLQLSNQDYSICIRMERNFCGIQYSACPDQTALGGNNRTRSFSLSGNSNLAVPAMIGSSNTPNSCPADWLAIPCVSNIGRPPTAAPSCTDRICGGTLAAEVSLQQATIFSTVKPFRLSFHTDGVEAPNDSGNRGFCLNYVQQPCTNTLR